MPISTPNNEPLHQGATASQMCAQTVTEIVPIVMRFIGAKMRSQGTPRMSLPQLKILAFISRNPGTSLTSAADDLSVTSATASHLVDRLVQRGYVSRVTDPKERRKVLLNLTEAGHTHLANCRKFAQDAVAVCLGTLSASKLSKIEDGLAVLKEAFNEVS